MDANTQTIVLSDIYSDGTVIKSTALSTYLELDRTTFSDPKEMDKFVKYTERIVRGSIEYKEFTSYVKDTLAYNYCAFTLESLEETGDVEIHHHPLTLYDVTKAITTKYISEEKAFNSFNIAMDVIQLHYMLKVGIVPLLGSLHKKFHNGFLHIPMELVVGDWKYLLNNASYILDEQTREKIEYYTSITISYLDSIYKDKSETLWYQGILQKKKEQLYNQEQPISV